VKVALGALEPVTHKAVQRTDDRAAPGCRREQDVLSDPLPLDAYVGGPPQQRRTGPDRIVGTARERVVDDLDRPAGRSHAPERALSARTSFAVSGSSSWVLARSVPVIRDPPS